MAPAAEQPRERRLSNQGNQNNNDTRGKRTGDQPDGQYGTRQVHAAQGDRSNDPAAGGNRKLKTNDNRPPRPKYTFEDMLDQPCKMHSGVGKPASHTTRQCNWTKRLAQGEALPPPPGLLRPTITEHPLRLPQPAPATTSTPTKTLLT